MKRFFYFLISTFLLQAMAYSCKSLDKTNIRKVNADAKYFPVDKSWTDSLANSGEHVKNALFNLYNNNVSKFNKDFNLSLTQVEFNNLKILSSETFRIDSVDFKNLNEESAIQPMLKLVKTEAESYVLNDSVVFLNMVQKFKNGQWILHSTGRIFDEVGNKIKDLHFKENIKVHDVIVDDYRYGKKKFIVFVRNGECINIKYGKEVPFIQRLLEFRTNLESGKIF